MQTLHDYCIVNYDMGYGVQPQKNFRATPFFLGNALSSKINTLFIKDILVIFLLGNRDFEV